MKIVQPVRIRMTTPSRVLLFTVSILLIAPAARPGSAQEAAPQAPAGTSRQTDSAQSALAAADDILQQMSRITGLPVKGPLKKELVSKPEVERYLKDNLHAEYTSAELHGEEAALKAFGVVPPDFDLEKFLVTFYTEQAAGFYDPRRQTMFMADWVEPDQQKIVLAHELTHALQDQSFDLWRFTHSVRDNDDALSARQALVEGYATLSMMQVMLGSVPVEKLPSLDSMMEQGITQSMAGFPVFSSAPLFLRLQMLFPYLQGMRFSRRAVELGGWKRLNQVFSNPPGTTRQIFDPDVYFAAVSAGARADGAAANGGQSNVRAADVALPDPPALGQGVGIQQVESNVMGALGYYALFGQFLSEAEGRKAADNWVSDRFLVYEGPQAGHFILISRTRWASPAAAADFCAGYGKILQRQAAQTGVRVSGGERGAFKLTQGDECRWFEGAPPALSKPLAGWLESLR